MSPSQVNPSPIHLVTLVMPENVRKTQRNAAEAHHDDDDDDDHHHHQWDNKDLLTQAAVRCLTTVPHVAYHHEQLLELFTGDEHAFSSRLAVQEPFPSLSLSLSLSLPLPLTVLTSPNSHPFEVIIRLGDPLYLWRNTLATRSNLLSKGC